MGAPQFMRDAWARVRNYRIWGKSQKEIEPTECFGNKDPQYICMGKPAKKPYDAEAKRLQDVIEHGQFGP